MSWMFDGCTSLKSLPDISKKNANNDEVMNVLECRKDSQSVLEYEYLDFLNLF